MAVLKYKDATGNFQTLVNYNIQNIAVVQETGTSTEAVMSQKAVTDQLKALAAMENSVGIQWNTDDSLKTITYIGNSALKQKLMDWIDTSPKPCEVKKDHTDFAYLTNTSGVASSTNWTTRIDGSASHYNTDDKADYLQMVELENINIKIKTDSNENVYAVIFNFDDECPSGFKRFLVEDTKLFGRYDSTANGTGYDICYGKNWTGNNSANNMFTANTNTGIWEITAWEYTVISWLMVFRYGTFDSQTALGSGVSTGSQSAAEAFTNGKTDSLTTPHGKVSVTGGYAIRFMYIENLYGLRWLWLAGWRGQTTTGYFTYDDEKANAAVLLVTTNADETHKIVACSGTYAKNVNKLGLLTESGGSSSSGFYDGHWSNVTANDRIMYVGGCSGIGLIDGVFSRYVSCAASDSGWTLRGRGAIRRSKVSAA